MQERRTRRWWRELFVATHYAKRKIAPGLLRAQMVNEKYSVTTLAHAVNIEIAKAYSGAGTPRTVSRQAVSLIINDDMDSCKIDLADALAKALHVPTEMLFDVLKKSNNERETRKQGAAA